MSMYVLLYNLLPADKYLLFNLEQQFHACGSWKSLVNGYIYFLQGTYK